MTGEHVPLTHETHDPEPKRKISRLDSNALIQGLERLRERIEERLERLEAVARERAQRAVPERSELEQRLQQRIHELEEAQHRLWAQAERRDQEWRVAVEQLEGDRTLLAEAWELLERERLEGGAALHPAHPQGGIRLPQGERTATPARARPELADPGSDQVAHAILKQFQALRNDVRRNARQRGSR
jgi:hypothetical protein